MIDYIGHLSYLRNQDFFSLFDSFQKEAFRFECLSKYDVEGETEDFKVFLSNPAAPPPRDFNKSWCDLIRSKKNNGASFKRVRFVSDNISLYLLFETRWAYAVNSAAGEEIRVLDSRDLTDLKSKAPIIKDFWIFDSKTCVLMEYDINGLFYGAVKVDDEYVASYVNLKEHLLQCSSPLVKSRLGTVLASDGMV